MKKHIIEAYKLYIQGDADESYYSSRNQKAPSYMHEEIAKELRQVISTWPNLEIRTSISGGEVKLKTDLHDKKLDIAIIDKDIVKPNNNVIIAISFKMPLASVNKNLKNYIEMNVGDTALIKEAGVPFYYLIFMDQFPIKVTEQKFDYEELSLKSLDGFCSVMLKPRTNKYRTDGILAISVNFNDLDFKKTKVGLNFSDAKGSKDREIIGNEHLKLFKTDIIESKVGIKVLNSKCEWEENFDDVWAEFKKMIKLEIELHEIRKKYM